MIDIFFRLAFIAVLIWSTGLSASLVYVSVHSFYCESDFDKSFFENVKDNMQDIVFMFVGVFIFVLTCLVAYDWIFR